MEVEKLRTGDGEISCVKRRNVFLACFLRECRVVCLAFSVLFKMQGACCYGRNVLLQLMIAVFFVELYFLYVFDVYPVRYSRDKKTRHAKVAFEEALTRYCINVFKSDRFANETGVSVDKLFKIFFKP